MASVFVVDDDPDGCQILRRFLERAGHEVRCAHTGCQALTMLLKDQLAPPDVILLDMMMPEMDGSLFLKTVRSYLRLQHVPVIILSAAPPEREDLMQLGINRTFRKASFQLDELLDAIKDVTAASKIDHIPDVWAAVRERASGHDGLTT